MSVILAHALCALLYSALGVYFWRTRWRAAAAEPSPRPRRSLDHLAIGVPLALHVALLAHVAWRDDGLYLGVGSALSLILALTVAFYWVGSWFYRIDGMHALVLPVAALAILLPLLLPSLRPVPNTTLPAFKLHLLISMAAYGLLTIASMHVLVMAVMEKQLHGGRLSDPFAGLPPLLTMETMLFQLIGAGFVLLTLTVASGVLFSESLFGKPMQLNHKTIFGLLSWAIFGALLGGRLLYGWRGRVAVRWTLAGFLMLVLAYIGSKFVLEFVLGR
jgi:ABC-type uncharacterized transport system permease subunit